MKKLIQKLLAYFAKRIVSKYKPKVIGITGSVGKTSAKEAIFAVVSKRYRTYCPVKNFNNEFGLPFAILGVDSPGRSVSKWIKLFMRAIGLLVFTQRYPEVLVLEYGIDHAGDMDYLVSIARPDIAVLTAVGVAHYEFFKDEAAIAHEKGKLLAALPETGIAILNADNEVAVQQRSRTNASVMTYTVAGANADVSISATGESFEGRGATMFSVTTPQGSIGLMTVNAVGGTHLSAIACAITVASALKMDAESIRQGVSGYKSAPSRLSVIGGIKHTTLIDDSYNASPDSMKAALALFGRIPAPIKMAVVGDMLELGALTDGAHQQVGTQIAGMHIDQLVTVGPNGKTIAQAARDAGMQDSTIISFDNSEEAKRVVQQLLKPDSLVLIKGSQGVRMEKITVEVMAEPMRARELVCRQSDGWINN